MNSLMLSQAWSRIKNLTDGSDDLIARVRSGDDEAFGVIFELHSRFVYKFVYAMLGERGAAEELTQETFPAAYKNIHGLRGESRSRTWLCGIAKNIAYKSFRVRRRD